MTKLVGDLLRRAAGLIKSGRDGAPEGVAHHPSVTADPVEYGSQAAVHVGGLPQPARDARGDEREILRPCLPVLPVRREHPAVTVALLGAARLLTVSCGGASRRV